MMQTHANPEDVDLYALGALEGREQEQLEAHLRACAACQGELRAARQRVLLLALSAPAVAPPAGVKTDLMRRLGRPRPTGAALRPGRRSAWGLRWSLGLAAAVVVLALATASLWRQNQRHQDEIRALNAELHATQAQATQDAAAARTVAQVVGAPDTQAVALLQQPGQLPGQGHVLYNARLGVLVYSGEMAPVPAGKSYQLWLVPTRGAPVSGGVVSPAQLAAHVVHVPAGLTAAAFAVTLEPLGGRPQPTGPKVLVGAVHS